MLLQDHAGRRPGNPDGQVRERRVPDAARLAVMLTRIAPHTRKHEHGQVEDGRIADGEEVAIGPEGGTVGPHLLLLLHQPLEAEGKLYKKGKEEEEGLVGGGQEDAPSQRAQTDQAHQQSGVDERVG